MRLHLPATFAWQHLLLPSRNRRADWAAMEPWDDPTSINHDLRLLEDTKEGYMGRDDLFGSTTDNVDSNDLNPSLNVTVNKGEARDEQSPNVPQYSL
ncbi:hypothetical protein GUJ93_ZPchr0015g6690 [Zizania palustris]|uniref:Uncharacterized protein n=1 Tax=Zizania palustris TaxID=103762 RepID=A0A8J5SYA8_ZIZPA|nr:hypothetical protein GUJ93_ZPchr0015g6690 [Zizania palustris]